MRVGFCHIIISCSLRLLLSIIHFISLPSEICDDHLAAHAAPIKDAAEPNMSEAQTDDLKRLRAAATASP